MRRISTLLLAVVTVSMFQLNSEVAAQVVVEYQQIKLKGYMKRDYKAVSFHLQNDFNSDVKISDVEFTGDSSVKNATIDATDDDKSELAILWVFGIGFFWLFLIPTAIALIATPFVLIKRSMTRKKTREEEEKYQEVAPREVVISAGESEDIVAIFPKEISSTRLNFKALVLENGTIEEFEERYSL